jgi:hypothetical protein
MPKWACSDSLDLSPVEKSLHTGTAEHHLGGAIYEAVDGDKPVAVLTNPLTWFVDLAGG